MRDWLPEEHLVWFLLDVVDSFDIAAFQREYRLGGVGREAFDPRMMIALLTYAYCCGVRSSRAIERACHTDVAFRVVCAQQVPDHTVISRFRAGHAEALADLFAQVLTMCARAGLGQVAVVAVDGTKIAANASLDQNRKEDWFRQQAKSILDQAAAVDAAEDAAEQAAAGDGPGDRLAPGWRDRSGRKERIKAALGEIEAHEAEQDKPVREAERLAGEARQAYEQASAERAAKAAPVDGRRAPGRPVDPTREGPVVARARRLAERAQQRVERLQAVREKASARRANVTDPQSRVMKTRQGWIQGYNNQTAVSEDGLILATRTSNDPIDMHQLVPMMDAAAQAAAAMGAAAGEPDREIGTVVADAGYFSESNLQAEGPDRLIAAGKRRNIAGDSPRGAPRTNTDQRRQTCHSMLDRLREPEAKDLYRRRAAIVEPVNGHLKDRRGLRRFARRGLHAAAAEFTFTAWVTNLMKLYTTQVAAT